MMNFYKSEEEFYSEMAEKVKDVISTDKKSLFYNSNKPVSYELSSITILLDEIKKFMFAQSACDNGYSEFLTKHCSQLGVDRKIERFANGTLKVIGRENAILPANTMVSTVDGTVFITQEELKIDNTGIGYVTIYAKEGGAKYNVEANSLTVFPTKYSGIISCTNEEEIKNGYDEEDDYSLLERYLFKVRTVITSGNVNHYKLWATEVDGVGKCKVFETTNEKGEHQEGHVLVIITDSNQRKAEQELLDACYNHIEDERPVNAKVHVISAKEVVINVSVNIYYDNTVYTAEDMEKNIKTNITNFLKTKAFSDSDKLNRISPNRIGTIIGNVEGVEDYDSMKLNDDWDAITIANTEIPVLGTLTITRGES